MLGFETLRGAHTFRASAIALTVLVTGPTFAAPSYTAVDLGTLSGTESHGNGINDNGEVVGYSDTTGDAAQHAFLYDGTTMHDLGTLGGTDNQGNGMNTSGEVVG